MRVACQNCDTTPVLPVPDSHSLVIATAHNPGQLQMELNSPYVVQMSSQSKHALFHLVVPYLNEVVIAAGNKHGLTLMETNTTDRT